LRKNEKKRKEPPLSRGPERNTNIILQERKLRSIRRTSSHFGKGRIKPSRVTDINLGESPGSTCYHHKKGKRLQLKIKIMNSLK